MEIEFYRVVTGETITSQGEFVVVSDGSVFEHIEHEILGQGYFRNFNVDWRITE